MYFLPVECDLYFVNILNILGELNSSLRAINSSFEGGGGLSAIVGASNAGSLSFRDTCRVTMSTSSFLRRRILAIMTGM